MKHIKNFEELNENHIVPGEDKPGFVKSFFNKFKKDKPTDDGNISYGRGLSIKNSGDDDFSLLLKSEFPTSMIVTTKGTDKTSYSFIPSRKNIVDNQITNISIDIFDDGLIILKNNRDIGNPTRTKITSKESVVNYINKYMIDERKSFDETDRRFDSEYNENIK